MWRAEPPTHDVAFVGPMLASHGGTETWHGTLLPRLQSLGMSVAGYGVLDGDDDSVTSQALRSAGIPARIGSDAPRMVARSAHVVVSWGLPDPRQFTAANQRIISVSHGDAHSPWTKGVMARAAQWADLIVTVSTVGLDTIPDEARAKAVVIANAIDPDRLTASAPRRMIRDRLGWSGSVLLHLGRLSAEKRPQLALEALAHLPGWTLAFAGSGAEEPALRALAERLGVADRVQWLGHRDDVGDLLEAADVCVCPSSTEGFGLSAAEALWVGCPLVACPVGFLEDGDAPATLVPLDAIPEAWAVAVQSAAWAIDQTDDAEMWARERFAPGPWAARWTDLIRSLIVEPAPVTPTTAPTPTGGPGTELTKLLAWFHAVPGSGCACKALAAEMDALGVIGCRRDIDRLATAIAASGSKATGIPVPVFAARAAINLACDRAEQHAPL